MTTMKKLFALMLAVLMLLSVCAVAGAATIEVINNEPKYDENKDNETYTAYKIFDVVKSGEAVSYTINQSKGWFSVLFDDNGTPKDGNVWFTATQIPGETGTWQISPAEDFKQENDPIVREAAAWLLANKGSNGGKPLQDGINTVDDGYYLVDSSLGTNLGLATTDFGMTIVEKNMYPSIDKKQRDDQIDAYGDDSVDVAVGDTINYQVTVTVPKSVKSDIVITDTMSSGLTFDGIDTVSTDATGLAQDTDWMVEEGTDGTAFKITILPTDAVKALAGENGVGTIVFTFTATVNNNALTDSEKKNEVKLTYSNFTQSDSVKYETYAAGAIKYDGATAEVNEGKLVAKNTAGSITYLEGAEFELLADNVTIKVSKDAAGYYYPNAEVTEVTEVITSGKDGKILIRGLDKDVIYHLKETKAPAGYNLLTTLVNLTLVSDADTITEEKMEKIENLAGATLPETGGIGTTIFYVAGGVLVLLAVVLLVTKRRVGENN